MPRKKKKQATDLVVELSASAKNQPRRFRMEDGTWVGIGAPIVIEAKPPKSAVNIPEATLEQYLEIAPRIPHLLKIIR
jgi:hypothetical protein